MHPLTKWAINKIESKYKNDIALLIATTGHTSDNDFHGECFNYFVPATERGNQLSQTFIIDGVGHDLFPMSWKRLENAANLNDLTSSLAHSHILYAKSQEESDHFHALQEKLCRNLKDPIFIYHKALERLDEAMDIYRTLMFETKTYRARSEAGHIQKYLSEAVAYLNGTYISHAVFSERQTYDPTPSERYYHCPDMLTVPDSFFDYANQILYAHNIDKLRSLCHLLICTTRTFIEAQKPVLPPIKSDTNFYNLADWYQELSLTWKRLRYFCMNSRPEEAYCDACYLQSELLIISPEFNLPEMNLLDSYDANDLTKLSLRSQQLELLIRKYITDNGAVIAEYDTLEDFLHAEHERTNT